MYINEREEIHSNLIKWYVKFCLDILIYTKEFGIAIQEWFLIYTYRFYNLDKCHK